MSDILEKAKAHHRERMDGEMTSITIPEWDNTRIYWKPLNLKQQNKIYKYLRDGSLEGLAEAIIVRARDENGDLLFKPMDKTEIMTMVDPGIINRIVEAMGEDNELDAEGIEKN